MKGGPATLEWLQAIMTRITGADHAESGWRVQPETEDKKRPAHSPNNVKLSCSDTTLYRGALCLCEGIRACLPQE